jgi:hypothetical protein
MHNIHVLLYVLAFICFILTAFGVTVRKVGLIALGLACWVLVPLLETGFFH